MTFMLSQSGVVTVAAIDTSIYSTIKSAVTTLTDGSYVVVWSGSGAFGGPYGSYFQHYDAAGNKIGGVTEVSTDKGDAQVSALSTGGFVVAWDQFENTVLAQVFDSHGVAVGDQVTVDSQRTAGYVYQVAVAGLQDGGFAVTWNDEFSDYDASYGFSYGIRAQRFGADGTGQGVVNVNSYTIGDQLSPTVAALAGGGYVLAWQSEFEEGGAYTGSGVYAQLYDAKGVKVGGETLVNTHTDDEQIVPQAAALQDGGYVITWTSEGQDSFYGGGIFAQRFDAGGAKVGTEFQVNTISAYDQYDSTVSSLNDGGFVVAWTQHIYNGGDGEPDIKLFAQVYNHAGDKAGSEILVAASNDYNDFQTMLHVSAVGADGFVVTWASHAFGSATETDIHSETFSQSPVAGDGLNVAGTDGSDNLAGTDGNDTLVGFGGDDHLTGGAGTDVLYGNDGDDVIDGGAGADTIFGGLGSDLMTGGAGNDIYYVDNASDIIVEKIAEGVDSVLADVSYVLADNVENLILYDHAVQLNIDATGNAGKNVLTGNGGNNSLDGGAGADTMIGGTGNDSYYVDNAGDKVIELANEGIDTVISSRQYVLGDNVEKLTLTGTTNISGAGNALANVVIGNDGDNHLSGLAGNDTLSGGLGNDVLDGGKGVDAMKGGAGDDRYYVENTGDVVSEFSNAGHDTVVTTLNYALGANVEDLIQVGTHDYYASGNALDNHLTGNSGNNLFHGNDGNDVIDGGKGGDKMYGGLGDDTFYVDNIGDVVIEYTGQGTDSVFSSISYALGGAVENLTLTGTANINGTGTNGDNILVGNAGDNILTGGKGHDTLTGGAGADTFVFGLASGADAITDFSASQNDKIDLSAWHAQSTAVVLQVGSDTTIDLGGGNIITLTGVTATDSAFLSHITW